MSTSNSAASVPVSADTATSEGHSPPRYGDVAQTLTDNGYRPVPLRRIDNPKDYEHAKKRKAPCPDEWSQASIEDAATWVARYPDQYTGIRTGSGLLVIDGDTDDAALAEIVTGAIADVWGDDVPERYRDDSERSAYFLRREGQHRKDELLLVRVDPGTKKEVKQKIELLGDGQQVVVSALHPDGSCYRWRNARSPRKVPLRELPEADDESIARFLELVTERAGVEGWKVGEGQSSRAWADGGAGSMLDERVCPSFTLETCSADEVRHLLEAQDPTADYPEWLGVLVSLAYWDVNEVGIDVAIEWSRCDAYPDPERDVRRVFASIMQGQYTGQQRTLASLIRDRQRHDAKVAEEAERTREGHEAERLDGYRQQIETAGTEPEIRSVMYRACDDAELRNAARVRLAEPIQKRMDRVGAGKPALRQLRKRLTVEGEADETGEGPEESGDPRARIIASLCATGDLFANQHGEPFIDLPIGDNGRALTLPVGGAAFVDHALGQARQMGKPIDARGCTMIADNVAAACRAAGTVRRTGMRVLQLEDHSDPSGAGDRFYIDHADEEGTVSEVSAAGVRQVPLVELEGMRFVRSANVAPLPFVSPLDADAMEEGIDLLWRYVTVAPQDRVLVLAVLLEWMRPSGDQPILALCGEAGAGKSMAAEFIRSLIDPQRTGMAGKPGGKRDAEAVLAESYMTAFDNLQTLRADLEDLFAGAATGAAAVSRRLYQNSGTVALDVSGPIMVTAIDVPFRQNDVLDRSVVLAVSRPSGHGRRDKVRLRQEFEADRPVIVAALHALLSASLVELPASRSASGHRFVGFARLGDAVHRVLGYASSFADVLDGRAREARMSALDGHPALVELVEFMTSEHADEPFESTAPRLLRRLEARTGRQPGTRSDYWPETAQKFGTDLYRQKQALSDMGLDFAKVGRSGRDGQRYRFTLNENAVKPDEDEIVAMFDDIDTRDDRAAPVVH